MTQTLNNHGTPSGLASVLRPSEGLDAGRKLDQSAPAERPASRPAAVIPADAAGAEQLLRDTYEALSAVMFLSPALEDIKTRLSTHLQLDCGVCGGPCQGHPVVATVPGPRTYVGNELHNVPVEGLTGPAEVRQERASVCQCAECQQHLETLPAAGVAR
jgi:hypothetical protein